MPNSVEELCKLKRVLSVQEILLLRNLWADHLTEGKTDKSKSQIIKEKKSFDVKWLQIYPWINEIRDPNTGKLLGILCQICREAYDEHLSRFDQHSFSLTKSLFINRPFIGPWGRLLDTCCSHEFTKTQKLPPGFTRDKLRNQILKEANISECRPHTQYIMIKKNKQETATPAEILQVKSVRSALDMNLCAMAAYMSNFIFLLQSGASVYMNFRKDLERQVYLFSNDDVIKHIKLNLTSKSKSLHYTSHRAINDNLDACYKSVLLGIYCEMCEDLTNGSPLIFGLILDLASRAQKFKEYCGVAIRYVRNGSIATRVIGFKLSPYKTGIALEQLTVEVLKEFNNIIKSLKYQLKSKFPVKLHPLPLLHMEHNHSFGADGALHSQDIHINQRLKKYNPRCEDHVCAPHTGHLTISHVVKGTKTIKPDEFLSWGLDILNKLHELGTSASRVSDLFMKAQINSHENRQWPQLGPEKGKSIGSRAMHRWESLLDLIVLFLRLPLTLESWLCSLIELKWKDSSGQKALGNVPYLKNQALTVKFYLYMSAQQDILEALIKFIKKMESNEVDVATYQDAVVSARQELELLALDGLGKCYLKNKNYFKSPNCPVSSWRGRKILDGAIIIEEDELDELVQEANKATLEEFNKLFSEERMSKVTNYTVLSMREARRNMRDISSTREFAKESIDALVKLFCDNVTFTAKWREPQDEFNKVFTAPALCDEAELREQFWEYKRTVFNKYLGDNPRTGKSYTTQEVIKEMINDDEEFLRQGTALRTVLTHYLVQCLDSITVERLFSKFAHEDDKYNQARTPDTMNKIMIVLKEMQEEEAVDLFAIVRILFLQKETGKRLDIPYYEDLLSNDETRSLLNTQIDLEERRRKRRKKYIKVFTTRRDEPSDDMAEVDLRGESSDEENEYQDEDAN